MLRSRIIPCLLIQDKGLVKTVNFKNPKYVGDPINAVRIFNEKEVDELIMLDIDASSKGNELDYKNIEHWASECRMPLCYGGGIKSVEQAQRVFSLGVEKVALSSAAIENPSLVSEIASKVGNQSVVVVLDVKKKLMGGYDTVVLNGKKSVKKSPFELAKMFEELGAGEVVINNVDRDGIMKGYDLDLVDKVREVTNGPLTILGGVGSLDDIDALIQRHKIIGASAGSLFVFKGKYRAVLINYPSTELKRDIQRRALVEC